MKFTNTFLSRFLTIVQIITFLVTPHMISCKCDQNKNDIQKEETNLGSEQHQAIELSLNRMSAEHIAGDQKTSSLEIENKGTEATVADQLKLQITREEGSSAMIQGSSRVGSTNVYMVDLPFILTAKEKKPYDLTIDSKDDKQAKFSIQLQYQGKDIGDAVKVSWEQGVMLGFDKIEYDRASGKVYVDMYNGGTKKASHVKLTYTARALDAQLDGVVTKEVLLGELDHDGKPQKYELGSLNFGNTNKSAVFEFSLSCTETGFQVIASETKTFIKADVKVSIDVDYDKETEQVECRLENKGTELAQGLELVYNNISLDTEGKLADLQLEPGNNLAIGDLAAGQKRNCTFKLDLKEAEAATFDFKVLYDGNPIAEKTETFQALPIKLALNIITPKKDEFSNYILYGSDHKMEVTIDKGPDSRSIDPAYLKVDMQPISGGTISKTVGGDAITEFSGLDIKNPGDKLTLYVNPTPEVKEANFKFQLKYKGQPLGDPVLIEWCEQVITIIKNISRLVSYKIGSFNLKSFSPMQLDDLTLVIEGDDEMTFEVCKLNKDWVEGAVKLADVASYTDRNKNQTADIQFKIGQHHNKKKTKATIIIKRGAIELAREEVDWVDDGVSLTIQSLDKIRNDEQTSAITIINTGFGVGEIDLNKIIVRLTNTANVPVTLAKVSGVSIDKTLAEVTGQAQLKSEGKVDIDLKVDAIHADKVATGIILELLDDEGSSLDKAYFIFNSKKFQEQLESYKPIIGDLENFLQNFVKNFDALKDNPIKLTQTLNALEHLTISLKKEVVKLDEIEHVDGGFYPFLSPFISDSANIIKMLEGFIEKTRAAIAALNSDEKLIELVKQLQKDNPVVQEVIEQAPEEIKNLKSHLNLLKTKDRKKIKSFLVADFNAGSPLPAQSIKALYEYYQHQLENCKALLINAGITDFNPVAGDLESIKQLKEIYRKMADTLPSIKNKVQEAFVAIFEGPDNFKEGVKEAREKKQPIELYNILLRQLEYLNSIQKGYSTELESGIFYQHLVKNYQALAAEAPELIKMEYEVKRKLKGLPDNAKLAFNAANYSFKIAKLINNEEIKQATRDTFISAIKAYEELKDLTVDTYIVNLGTDKRPNNKSIQKIIDELKKRKDSL